MEVVLVLVARRPTEFGDKRSVERLVAQDAAFEQATDTPQHVRATMPLEKITVGCDVVPRLIRALEPLFLQPTPVKVVVACGEQPQFVTPLSGTTLLECSFTCSLLYRGKFRIASGSGFDILVGDQLLIIRLNLAPQLLDVQLEALVILRTSLPGQQDERLLAHKMLGEPRKLLGFFKAAREPVFDIVLHPLQRHPRAAQAEGDEKKHHTKNQ